MYCSCFTKVLLGLGTSTRSAVPPGSPWYRAVQAAHGVLLVPVGRVDILPRSCGVLKNEHTGGWFVSVGIKLVVILYLRHSLFFRLSPRFEHYRNLRSTRTRTIYQARKSIIFYERICTMLGIPPFGWNMLGRVLV